MAETIYKRNTAQNKKKYNSKNKETRKIKKKLRAVHKCN